MFVRLDFFLSRIMAWNLSGLIIISFFVNQSLAILLSDSNVPINLESVSPQAHRVLSSAKLCIEAISMKKNKSLTERLNKIGPSIEPCVNFVMVAISIVYLCTLFSTLKTKINQSSIFSLNSICCQFSNYQVVVNAVKGLR